MSTRTQAARPAGLTLALPATRIPEAARSAYWARHQAYLQAIRFLQAAYVIITAPSATERHRVKYVRSDVLPWWRFDHHYPTSVPDEEIKRIDDIFDREKENEIAGYTNSLKPKQRATWMDFEFTDGADQWVFLFPDGAVSFLTYAYEVLRRVHKEKRSLQSVWLSTAQESGLYRDTSPTERFLRMKQWLSQAEILSISNRFAGPVTKGLKQLAAAIVERWEDHDWLQRRVLFNLHGHFHLRSGEYNKRSLLLLIMREFQGLQCNLYATLAVATAAELQQLAHHGWLTPFTVLGLFVLRQALQESVRHDLELALRSIQSTSGLAGEVTDATESFKSFAIRYLEQTSEPVGELEGTVMRSVEVDPRTRDYLVVRQIDRLGRPGLVVAAWEIQDDIGNSYRFAAAADGARQKLRLIYPSGQFVISMRGARSLEELDELRGYLHGLWKVERHQASKFVAGD